MLISQGGLNCKKIGKNQSEYFIKESVKMEKKEAKEFTHPVKGFKYPMTTEQLGLTNDSGKYLLKSYIWAELRGKKNWTMIRGYSVFRIICDTTGYLSNSDMVNFELINGAEKLKDFLDGIFKKKIHIEEMKEVTEYIDDKKFDEFEFDDIDDVDKLDAQRAKINKTVEVVTTTTYNLTGKWKPYKGGKK